VGSPFAGIEQLANRLPFRVDDSDAVNNLFAQVVTEEDPRDLETLEIWTYCFVWRYFTWKQIQNETGSVADFESVITDAFQRIRAGRAQLSASSRYASWVSVVCRNTFLNFARKARDVVFLDDRGTELLESDPPMREHDPALLRQAIEQAVLRLPSHLVECARLYFLDRLDYEEMAEVTGKSAATLRAYVHKSMRRLATDPWLREFCEYVDDELFHE
jgi:RNA polymerase sigma factor (sigma-70 family)